MSTQPKETETPNDVPDNLKDLLDAPGEDKETETPTETTPPESQEETPPSKDDQATPDEKEKEETPPATPDLASELRDLKTLVRQQARDNKALRDQLADTEKKLTEAGHLPEVTQEEKAALEAAQARRQDQLENFLETMRSGSKYSDVDEVVSQNHADDIIDMMAKAYSQKENVSLGQSRQLCEQYVWSQRNPYRYLYNIIKDKHPDYQKHEEDKETPPAKPPKKSAPSLENIKGGGGRQSGREMEGWTYERIMELPEEQLSQVPQKVYDAFMRGELDPAK